MCSPAYVLGRVGLLLLGSKTFFVVGVILLALGLTLQAGATGAIKAIKMSAKLVAGHDLAEHPDAEVDGRGETPADAAVPPASDG